MGEFIVVLKYMHVRPVFFDCIVIANAPMLWFKRWWDTSLRSITIKMKSSYFSVHILYIVILSKEYEGIGWVVRVSESAKWGITVYEPSPFDTNPTNIRATYVLSYLRSKVRTYVLKSRGERYLHFKKSLRLSSKWV